MKPEVIRHLIDEFGRSTLLQAYRLHVDDGEGATAIGQYLGLPTHYVSACIRAGEALNWMREEQRSFEGAICD